MRTQLLADRLALASIFTVGLVSTCQAAHGHQHDEVLDHINHHPAASSGSSSNVTAVDRTGASTMVLPLPTSSGAAADCFNADCGSLNANTTLTFPTHIKAAPEASLQTQQLHQDTSSTSPTRRRFRSRPTEASTADDLPSSLDALSTTTDASETAPSPMLDKANESSEQILSTPLRGEGATDVFYAYDSPSADFAPHAISPRQDNSYQTFATSLCPAGNGTTYTSAANIQYQVICGIDFLDNDLPFQLVSSFENCVQKCDAWNYDHHHVQCLASLYLPNRLSTDNDCYLKTSVARPTVSTQLIEGAIRLTGEQLAPSLSVSSHSLSSTSSLASTTSDAVSNTFSSTSASATGSISLSSAASSTQPSSSSSTVQSSAASSSAAAKSAAAGSEPGITYASGNSIIVPKVAGSHLHGPSKNTPSTQYVNYQSPPGVKLADSLLTVGVNSDLTTGYDISLETGILEVNISTQSLLSPLSGTAHLSRDGGQGGFVNGQHLFIFCDTGSYTAPSPSAGGNFLGFVSSSVAVDTGMNGLYGNALNLLDGIGEWSDNTGRMRGFAPLTEGEMAYNQVMQGNGQRYAIWPESSIIPVDATTGIVFAPIVYDNVNRATKATVFTYTGATLLTITAGGKGGPVAERTVDKIFNQEEVEWGCAGGIRSWGSSGIGGDDGSVYIFGGIAGGILLGRTSPANVAKRDTFEYWDGTAWTNKILDSSSKAFFIQGPFMDINVFYSPRHLTFIIVYLTIYADSTFYYRYLEADQGILPAFVSGGNPSSDYVENILKYSWSDQQVLYKAAPGLSGHYIYAGAVHEGYYGSNDITNGGSRMLLSWTAPTGQDPSQSNSEYQMFTAEVNWA